MLNSSDVVVWNNKIRLEDKGVVGSEIANLGELAHHSVSILHRLVVTPYAFDLFAEQNNLTIQIKHLLGSINHDRYDSVSQVARHIRNVITRGQVCPEIYKPIFKDIEKFETKSVSLYAHYFKDGRLVGSGKWGNLEGDAVIVEHIRIAFAHLFSPEYLAKHTIHHHNHHTFSVCLFIEPEINYALSGHVATHGKSKGEYEIEAHNAVRFSYNKHSQKLVEGRELSQNGKVMLGVSDLKKLLAYAHAAEKAFYLPHVLYWGKHQNEFIVTKVLPSSEVEVYHDTYHSLVQNVTVHPGITIGRLKVIDERSHTAVVLNDEIVMVKRLDKKMLDAVKKAKGIIIDEEPNPEILHALKSYGIPTVIHKKDRFLYSTGDVVSLNATTGEIKRGNMLVS